MDLFFYSCCDQFSFQTCISKDYGKGGEGYGETDKKRGKRAEIS